MDVSIQEMLFQFLGGLGIFLFGIKYMGDGLQKSAGDRLRDLLDKYTTNPIMGILVGILVTVLIQSSSGTTVITVGLVSAGFMTLRQAIGVIMGANIGTTITAFIIGIDVGEYALPIIFVGAFLLFFFKNQKLHNFGQILFGFGLLFYGLELMSSGMKPLRTFEWFHDLTVSLSDYSILGVVVGTVFTLLVQSSSATIGILQGLFGEGLIDLQGALPVLFGDNIGTTITALLASIGASVAARRAACVHILFNVFGTIIFMILLVPFTSLIGWFQQTLGLNPEMTIAFAHGTFNITNTLIMIPFIGVYAWIVTKLIPGKDTVIEYKPEHLDERIIDQSPSIALGQAKKETLRMGEFAIKGLEETYNYLLTNETASLNTGNQIEEALNNLDHKITDYLVKVSTSSLSANESDEHNILMHTITDIERIGDHFENILEFAEYKNTNKATFTDEATEGMSQMFTLTIEAVKEAMAAIENQDKESAYKVLELERKIDKMERQLRKQHVIRLNNGSCSAQASLVYVDILSNLERIGDHAKNIAETIIGEQE
ncbi:MULTISPECIES: Na/Pi cotransporter family protein [Bacillaceae]|uniref:Na/Pi cotransporter family protein n=1 Tax=Bacillaceae TaxID=186817 RepID=UPI000A80113D|nr:MULTISPECIES: Na/Pi cotransporter family protein [Bacillaceae]